MSSLPAKASNHCGQFRWRAPAGLNSKHPDARSVH
jgi:hypothetical protein